jgi:hypothetical protein
MLVRLQKIETPSEVSKVGWTLSPLLLGLLHLYVILLREQGS